MNKTRKNINNNNKTKKNKGSDCSFSKIYKPFVEDLENTKLFKNEVKLGNFENKLVQKLLYPYAPEKIMPNNDFYTYINYVLLKETSKKADNLSKNEKYFVQIDDFRVLQHKVYLELMDIVKDYIKNNNSRKSKLIGNVYNSLNQLNETTTKTHINNLINTYHHYTSQDKLWEFLAEINRVEILNWACPIVWNVLPNEKMANKYSINISQPELSLYDYLLYLEPFDDETKEEQNYKKLVKRKYLEYIGEIFDSCLGKNHGLKAEDVFQVEYELLTAMGCGSVKNESKEYYNIVKKDEALKMYGFDWETFTKTLGYKKTPDFFICSNLSYLKCICKLLKEDWKSPKWKSFWYYIYLRQIIRFDRKKREIYFNFNKKFLTGQPEIIPLDIFPIFGLSLTFNTFLSEEYIKKFKNQIYIDYANVLGKDLLTVYKRIISHNTWLSPKTKKYALLKLEHMKLILGQPENMREDPLLDYTSDDAWGNMLKLAYWKSSKYVELNNADIIDIPIIDWNNLKLVGKQPYIVNAFYTPSENSIYIPLAYLQKPFLDLEDRGIEYNLSHLGGTLAHEMSHALDEMGSKFDYNGNLHDWWSKEDKVKYKKIINDITKQYETFAKYDGINFDASIGIGENMADISGLAICEQYLRDYHMNNNEVIPIVSLSFKEFFVYFAVQQRQHVYRNALKAQLKTNPHPLDKYRTNVPLSRSKLFRKLFYIKKNDKMFWHTTNKIWSI